MADIFREIDEDLRRDRLLLLWRRYSTLVYVGAAAIVLGTAGAVQWRDYQRGRAEDLGARFSTAETLSQTDAAKATKDLEVLAGQGDGGYRLLARFQAAALKVKSGDKAAGIAALAAISADGGVDRPYRDLATVLAALDGLDDTPPAATIERVKPLTVASGPWRFTALEITALAKLKDGDQAGALTIYQQLADDLDAPQSLRARAAEVLGAFRHQG